MKRHLVPGRVDRHGIARPSALAHLRCTGHCEADLPCECELACEVAPDADRVIAPPVRTPEDDAYILRVRRCAIALALLAWAGLAGLLELFGAPEFRL